MDADAAKHLLAHALPPAARHERFRRGFDQCARFALLHCGCNDAQIERLQGILPAIAYYAEAGPKLADVRAHLADAARKARAAASSLRALLDAPEHEEARSEARDRLLEALAEVLRPERCQIDPRRVSFFHHYDEREDEARRLLGALADVVAAVDHARERMPNAQTRAVAHWYPLALIDAALSVDGPSLPPSESAASKFREIAGYCYSAARVANPDPQAAIRRYLKAQQQV